MSLSDWLPWVRNRRTRELAEELRAHLEMATAERIARGESPADADTNARREFGNAGLVQDVARDHWSGMALERFAQDAHLALRMFRRAPGFTAIAVLTIAVGIGATTAVFGVVDATLIHPLPYPHPEQLVRIEDDLLGVGANNVGMSTPEWRDLVRTDVFTYVSPTWFDDNNLTGVRQPERVAQLIVAPNYFAMLGVKPQLGATFNPEDVTAGFNGQAVISDGLWRRAFGGDSNVVGRVVQVDSDSYRVIGVMPPGFQAPGSTKEERSAEVWSAMGFAAAPITTFALRSQHFPGATARLNPDFTLAEAQRRIDVLVASLRRQYPADYPPKSEWTIRLVPLKDNVVGNVRQSLLFLLAAVGLVLLIACGNVANLLLARATSRGREMAVRQAIGSGSSRLTRQLLTESLVLSVLGGIAGVVLLLCSKPYLIRLEPSSLPRLNDIAISWGVLLFAFGISLAAGLLFGLAPALHVRGLDITRVLKQEGRGSTGSGAQTRTRRTLVVAELALSLILMTAAVLLLRSFWSLDNAPLGFDAQGVTIIRTRLPYPNDAKEDLYATAADEAPFIRDVLRRMRSLPGVQDAAIGSASSIPLDHPEQNQNVFHVVFEEHAAEQPSFVTGAIVLPGYFRLLRIPLIRGRLLTAFDDEHSPSVAVVNEAMARTYWPDENPIGKHFRFSPTSPTWTTVVGVVVDARTETLQSDRVPVIYGSVYQQSAKRLAIYLRGTFVPAVIADQVRHEIQAVNAALPVFGATTLVETVSGALEMRRFSMELIAIFALAALLLAALGIYGVIAYMVSERTHELGVRLALGASASDVMRMILSEGLRLSFTGAGLGLIGALIVSHVMSGLLYGVSPRDPLVFAAVSTVLTAVALASCCVPALRAVRVDPIVALRC